jgi:hypothetical protein
VDIAATMGRRRREGPGRGASPRRRRPIHSDRRTRRHLTNFRVRVVYSPALLRALTKAWKGYDYGPSLWETREEAECTASRWQERTIEARFDDEPWSIDVSDPPPLDLQRNGKTYYLALFNARRALYSRQRPPIERPPVS